MSRDDRRAPDDADDAVQGSDAALHAELGALLRGAAPTAPPAVQRRALGRIDAERQVLLIARTLGGALLRVVAALPDYLPARGARETTEPVGRRGRTPGERSH